MASGSLDRFLASAAFHGVPVDLKEFPDGARTAAEAATALGCDVRQIVKSLVFVVDDTPVLALTSGGNRVDETKLAGALGAGTVRKADADEVRQATGYAIGGTPPFGHTTDLRVVCDRDLPTFEEVWAAAGTPAAVFGIAPDLLLRVTGAAVIDLASEPPAGDHRIWVARNASPPRRTAGGSGVRRTHAPRDRADPTVPIGRDGPGAGEIHGPDEDVENAVRGGDPGHLPAAPGERLVAVRSGLPNGTSRGTSGTAVVIRTPSARWGGEGRKALAPR